MHDSQLLFRLRKVLLPGFPQGRVPRKVILTVMTANEVYGLGRMVSEKQAVKRKRWLVQNSWN